MSSDAQKGAVMGSTPLFMYTIDHQLTKFPEDALTASLEDKALYVASVVPTDLSRVRTSSLSIPSVETVGEQPSDISSRRGTPHAFPQNERVRLSSGNSNTRTITTHSQWEQ